MKPQHKSATPVAMAHAGKSKASQLKSSESFLNVSQPSLSASKTLIDKLMKLEGKPGHRHTSSDAGSSSAEPKRHVVLRRKAPHDPPRPASQSASHFKPSLTIKCGDTSKLGRTISEMTTPTSQAQTRNTKEPSRTSVQTFCEIKEHLGSEVIALEVQLTERLRQLTKDSDQANVFESQFPLYSEVFQQIIDRDKKFGTLLMKVRGFYEEWLTSFSKQQQPASEKLVEQYAEQLKIAKKKLQKYHEEKKLMLRKIEKLSKETLELARKLDECEDDYDRLKEKMDYISNVDLEEMSVDEKTWKYLVVENQGYHELFRKMQTEFKTVKDQEEKLLMLVQKMKDRGFPIEDLEKELYPARASEDEEEDDDDFEPLTTEPEKKMLKPKIVPRLRLEILQESPSDSKLIPAYADELGQEESELNEESLESGYGDSSIFDQRLHDEK